MTKGRIKILNSEFKKCFAHQYTWFHNFWDTGPYRELMREIIFTGLIHRTWFIDMSDTYKSIIED